jgi:thiol-disulfide isomerase/thioredoxin
VVRLTNSGDAPIKLLSTEVDDPEISVRVQEQQSPRPATRPAQAADQANPPNSSVPQQAFLVYLTIPDSLQLPAEGRKLTIKTDDPEKPEIVVPINAYKPPSTQPVATPPRRPAEELVGKPAPEFTIKTFEGKSASSGDFKNYAGTVLNFVAPNCGFCKRQVPSIEALRAEYESKGIRFINVIERMRKPYTQQEAEEVFKGVGSKLEMVADFDGEDTQAMNKVGRLFKANSFPTLFVIDRSGQVEQVILGAKPDLANTLKQTFNKLLEAKPPA